MTWISLLQPSDLEEWESAYHASVKTPEELDVVAARAWTEFQHYRDVGQNLTEADFQGYMRDLVLKRTHDGWSQRRDEVLNYLKEETGIPFDYLRDSPVDWRPRAYDIDFAALHPESGYWLAVKALPTSTPTAPYPGVGPRLAEMRIKHGQFAHKFGRVVEITFKIEQKVKKFVDDEAIARVQQGWTEVGERTG